METENKDYAAKKSNCRKQVAKYEVCKVTGFDPCRKTVNILFKGFGIQLSDIEKKSGDSIKVKYTSDIGKSDFTFEFVGWI